jgi:hypothetical protein
MSRTRAQIEAEISALDNAAAACTSPELQDTLRMRVAELEDELMESARSEFADKERLLEAEFARKLRALHEEYNVGLPSVYEVHLG